MKKILFVIIMSFAVLCLDAQTQSGRVRTAGSHNQKGQPISDVSVKMAGDYTVVLSDKNGDFEIMMSGLKNGDPIQVERVFKLGYLLIDEEILSTERAFSNRVPLEIVMKSKVEVANERAEIEELAYRKATQRYESRVRQLEAALKSSEITQSELQNEMQLLQNQFQAFESLITTMSKHYAMTDYDRLSETDALINSAIREGDFLKADSLLNAKGNMQKRINAFHSETKSINDAQIQIEIAQQKLSKRKSSMLRLKTELASDLYNKYTVSVGKFNLDSAAYYMVSRADLDTTNVDWQLEAGDFLENYLGQYQEAYDLYMRGLRSAEAQSESNVYRGNAYNALALLYVTLDRYDEAMHYLNKARHEYKVNCSPDHPNNAFVLNNLAGFYGKTGQIDSMLVYAKEALKINISYFGENSKEVATDYNTLANAYQFKGDWANALECYNKSMDIFKQHNGENSLYVGLGYSNLGGFYADQNDYHSAVEYCLKAWNILSKITSESSPHRVTVSSNLAVYYGKYGDISNALRYVDITINILENSKTNQYLLSSAYLYKARWLNQLGQVQEALHNYDQSCRYCNEQDANLLYGRYTGKASVQENIGDLVGALDTYKRLLALVERISSNDDSILVEIDGFINQTYINILTSDLYPQDIMDKYMKEYKEFVGDKIYYFMVASDGPAKSKGLQGVNYLLGFNEWEMDSLMHFFEVASSAVNQKRLVIYTPDGIKEYVFEDKLGARIYMSRIPKEWKVMMMQDYETWKKSQE